MGVIVLILVLIGIFVWILMVEEKKKGIYIQQEQMVKEELLKEFRLSYVEHIIDITRKYQDVLIDKWDQKTYINEWGDLDAADFFKELEYFIFNKIRRIYDYTKSPEYKKLKENAVSEYEYFAFDIVPNESNIPECAGYDGERINYHFHFTMKDNQEKRYLASWYDTTVDIICVFIDTIRWLESVVGTKKKITISLQSKNPLDYEKQIANKLKQSGFNAHATKGSGDQGADVLADKNGVKFAIQCKMYSKPVGNKAVQEANTARDFYKCDYAVVVTNAGYTKSARQAANACNVILLNENQLDKLDNYIE